MRTLAAVKELLYVSGSDEALVAAFMREGVQHAGACADREELAARLGRLQQAGYDSKELLVIRPYEVRVFQMCPGSPGMVCCNYRLLNTGFGCLYDCTYCYLQSFLNSFGLMVFSNPDRSLEELRQFVDSAAPGTVCRIGTGEYTDSMMIDRVTGYARRAIGICSGHPGMMLECKTKSSDIDHLLDLPDKGSAVMAWSVNTPEMIARYEKDTATLEERLDAAAKAAAAGYYLAFHFDPLIRHAGWIDGYRRVVAMIFARCPADRVVWISLGGFRYAPDFAGVMQLRFPDERLTLEEMFPGPDGKLRYAPQVRCEIYAALREEILRHAPCCLVICAWKQQRCGNVLTTGLRLLPGS
jgi:spore photoproduct lyase